MCLSRADTATNPSPLGGWNSYCSPRSLRTLLLSPRPRPSLMVRSPCLRRCFAVTQLHCSRKHHARNRVILPREHRPHASSRSIAGVSTCQPQFARARALASAVRTQPAQVRLARPRTLNAFLWHARSPCRVLRITPIRRNTSRAATFDAPKASADLAQHSTKVSLRALPLAPLLRLWPPHMARAAATSSPA